MSEAADTDHVADPPYPNPRYAWYVTTLLLLACFALPAAAQMATGLAFGTPLPLDQQIGEARDDYQYLFDQAEFEEAAASAKLLISLLLRDLSGRPSILRLARDPHAASLAPCRLAHQTQFVRAGDGRRVDLDELAVCISHAGLIGPACRA